jgi:adenylosuccinate lyase
MIPRYEQPEITKIWSNENKLRLWQETELAVIRAKVALGKLDREIWLKISRILRRKPIDIPWWLMRDKEINHDLNAFIDERRRYLPPELQHYLHEDITSYDAEESAFGIMLKQSVLLIKKELLGTRVVIRDMAIKYRYTVMMGRTHGQEAELQTFGKRCITWFRQLDIDLATLKGAEQNLKLSKISGAVGNFGGISPEVEKAALKILGFKPFYGATQIMPRELYAPIAGALCQTVLTLDKISTDIRLGARSGNPIYREPFSKKQKGSSRMPHKKNTIATEQIEGMARLARGCNDAIMGNIKTWEERAIEQSCVERVAWPDLFHVTIHSLRTITKVLKGLVVYPDNMLLEVINSRGCYASGEAKTFLAERGVPFGLTAEEAYLIVQLAAFNAFRPQPDAEELRSGPPISFEVAEWWLARFQSIKMKPPVSIQDIIIQGKLETSPELEASADEVARWNKILADIFRQEKNSAEFRAIFSVPYLLRNEKKLYQETLGVLS